ncbi:hypothetical protein ACFRR6_02155 [Streptomyces sp. NPDC056891]|uniref:hypothetical protein n=1 Tax=Streptomyces sp. NPDC056891 TaxID=3345961 RepID=UPI00369AFC09
MPPTGDDHQAAIESAKLRIPSLEQLFQSWPTNRPQMPSVAHTEATLYETRGFDDPRLVLYTGISQLPRLTVGWALFGSARNVHPGHPSLPHTLREALTDPDAARALQFMAVDHQETDEAAAETLSDHRTVRTLAGLASTAHLAHQGQPLRVDVGTEIYAYHSGPFDLGPTTTDVVCIGSPIWITGA